MIGGAVVSWNGVSFCSGGEKLVFGWWDMCFLCEDCDIPKKS